MFSQLVMSHGKRRLLSYRSSVGPRTVTPPAAQVAGDTPAVEQPPPAPDGPRPDGSGSTLQLDQANSTVDRNQMITTRQKKKTQMITSSNRKHPRSEPPSEKSYSPHGTITSPGASQGSKAEENGSTRPKRRRKPNRHFDPATWEL